ncbi:hypothetical protein [Acidaminococcus massiliensis]|jgi:hypothetical protein|uniref:hypothetical protein n=1 Tax=Acidaminococcus massiliensis TaxID=1852375 RepID=UPI0020638F85|nr:hypothetical protein [Acidaminococcus massiliensis]DAR24926.1 MAG TPA: hypothetical protein [Caudoviricetes sp.]
MKLTRKDVENESGSVFIAPYCSIHVAERHMVAIGHNNGIYGWNWTAYKVPDCAATVVTGYRSFPHGRYLNKKEIADLNNCKNAAEISDLLYKLIRIGSAGTTDGKEEFVPF